MTTARTRGPGRLVVWLLVAMLADQIEADENRRYQSPMLGSIPDEINKNEMNYRQPSIDRLSNSLKDNMDLKLVQPIPTPQTQQQQQSIPQGVNSDSPIQDNIQVPTENNSPPSMQDIGSPQESNNVQPQFQSMRQPQISDNDQPQFQSMRQPQISDNDSPLIQNNDSPPPQDNNFPPMQDNVPLPQDNNFPPMQDNVPSPVQVDLPQEQQLGMIDQTQRPYVPPDLQQESYPLSNLNQPQDMNFNPSPTQDNAQQLRPPQEVSYTNKAPLNTVQEQMQQPYQQNYPQQQFSEQFPLQRPQQMPTQPIVSYPQQQPTVVSAPQQMTTQPIASYPQQQPTVVSAPQQMPTQPIVSYPQQPTVVSAPQRMPTQPIVSYPQQPTVVSVPQQQPMASVLPQQQSASVPQQPQLSSYYSYNQIPIDQQNFRGPQQPNYQMPYQTKMSMNYPKTGYNDRPQMYINNYQVQPSNVPPRTGKPSRFPINLGSMLPMGSLSAFNPVPMMRQSIGSVGGLVGKVHGYSSGLQSSLTDMALNLDSKLVDGAQTVMHSIANAAMAVPDAILNAKRQTLDHMRSSRQGDQSNRMGDQPQDGGTYYSRQPSQNEYADDGYMSDQPPYASGNVQLQQQSFRDQPQQQQSMDRMTANDPNPVHGAQPIHRYVTSGNGA